MNIKMLSLNFCQKLWLANFKWLDLSNIFNMVPTVGLFLTTIYGLSYIRYNTRMPSSMLSRPIQTNPDSLEQTRETLNLVVSLIIL